MTAMNAGEAEHLEPLYQCAFLVTMAASFRPVVVEWGSAASLQVFDRAVASLQAITGKGESRWSLGDVESELVSTPDSLCDDSNVPQYYSMRSLGVVYCVSLFARAVSGGEVHGNLAVVRFNEAASSVVDLVRDLAFETRDAAGADAEMSLLAAFDRARRKARSLLVGGKGLVDVQRALETVVGELGTAYSSIISKISTSRGWGLVRS